MIWLSASRTFLVRCVGATASLGFSLLLANVLTPTAMGTFAIAVSVAIIAATVSTCGLHAYVLYCTVEHPDIRRIAAFCLAIAGVVGALWATCFPGSFDIQPAVHHSAFVVFQLAVPFLAMNFVLSGLLKAGNFPAAAIFLDTGCWQTAMCACAILMLYTGNDSLLVVAACFSAGAALAFAGFLAAVKRLVLNVKPSGERTAPQPIIRVREVTPLAAASIVQVLIRWSDTLWLALWLDAQAVAVYTVCTRLAGSIAFIDQAINAIAAPRFARHHRNRETHALHMEFRRAIAISAAFGVLSASAMALLAPFILGLIGPPYTDSAGILQIAAALMAIHVTLVPVGHLAVMSGRGPDYLKASCAALALQQAVYLLLIPHLGMAAALAGFALPQALANLLTWRWAGRRE